MLNFLPAVTRAKALALRECPDELAKFLRNADLPAELVAQTAHALGACQALAPREAQRERPLSCERCAPAPRS